MGTTDLYGYRGLVLYLNTPARMGMLAGLQLAGGDNTQSLLKHCPIMDMEIIWFLCFDWLGLGDGQQRVS